MYIYEKNKIPAKACTNAVSDLQSLPALSCRTTPLALLPGDAWTSAHSELVVRRRNGALRLAALAVAVRRESGEGTRARLVRHGVPVHLRHGMVGERRRQLKLSKTAQRTTQVNVLQAYQVS